MNQLGAARRVEQNFGLLAHAVMQRVQKQSAEGLPQACAPRFTSRDVFDPRLMKPQAQMTKQSGLAAAVDALDTDESAQSYFWFIHDENPVERPWW